MRSAVFFDSSLWLMLGALVGLLGVGIVLMRHFRDHQTNPTTDDHDQLTNYREMHRRGELSDEEYRTIKSKMTARLKQAITDTDKTA